MPRQYVCQAANSTDVQGTPVNVLGPQTEIITMDSRLRLLKQGFGRHEFDKLKADLS